MSERICSVETCDKPHCARDYCQGHYVRVKKTGDPQAHIPLMVSRYGDVTCADETCDKPPIARGWCTKHYARWRKYDDIQVVLKVGAPSGESHPNWTAVPSYGAMHRRIQKQKGPASQFPCTHCGGQAHKWAYDHRDLDEVISPKGWPYSLKQEHYQPYCDSAHKAMDVLWIKQHEPERWLGGNAKQDECKYGHPLVEGNLYFSKVGRSCRECSLRRSRERKATIRSERQAEPTEEP